MSSRLPDRRPEIDYPTRWKYKVIGSSREEVEAAATAAAGERDHVVALSRRSASDRYVSVDLEVEVESEEARLEVFEMLRREDAVLLVL